MTGKSPNALRAQPFVSEMTEEQVAAMASCMRIVDYSADTYLFREGQPADALFLIQRGRVAVEVHAPGKGTLQLETLSEGDILGWSLLFPPRIWHVDARSIEPTVSLVFDGACLRAKMDADIAFAYVLTRRVLYEVHNRLEQVRLQQADVYKDAPV